MCRFTKRILAGFLAVCIVTANDVSVLAAEEEKWELANPPCADEYGTLESSRGSQDGWDSLSVLESTDGLDGLSVSGSTDGEDDNTTAATGLGIAYRTQKEIEAFLAEKGALFTDEVSYAVEPQTEAPYKAGVLSDETLEAAINMMNQVRFIAGIPYDVTLNTEYSALAQAGSLLNYVNGKLSHYPSRPDDMDTELYELGYQGASSSNIAWSSTGYYTLNRMIRLWMSDSDSSNIDRIGHRRWILNPSMEQTGFGVVKGSKGSYGAVYVFDNWYQDTGITGVAWPAQNMPVDYFGVSDAWSVSMGKVLDADAIKVVLTRKSDGKTWNFSSSSADGYFNVENSNYGQCGCIIFRPTTGDITSFSDGDSYHVEITQNEESYVSYDVNFFEPEKAYTITYHLNGGVNNSENPSNYRSGSDTIVLKDPVKEGYIFDGWYKDSSFKNRITQIEKGSKGNLNLYAKWLARDYDKPYVSATTVTMNTKRTDGVTLGIYAAYGNGMSDITAVSEKFTIAVLRDETTDEIRGVRICPKEELPNGTYHIELRYTTQNSADDNVYLQDITVKVVNKTPKLTVRQTAKFNYFYTDEAQTLEITSAEGEVVSVSLQDNSDFEGKDCGEGKLFITLKQPEKTGKPATKAAVKVQIEGYREPVVQKVTISVNKKAPTVTAVRNKTVFSELAPADKAESLLFTDKTRGENITREDVTLSVDTYVSMDENFSMQPILTEGRFAGNKKSVKLTFWVQKQNWSKPVKVSHSLQITGVPSVNLAKKTVTLNSVYRTCEEVLVGLNSQSAFENYEIEWKIQSEGDSTKSAFLDVNMTANQSVMAGIKNSLADSAVAGSYKYQVWAVLRKGQETYETKPVNLTIKVNAKENLTATTQAKGKIDVLSRETGITYTIKGITNSGYDAEKLVRSIQSAELVNVEGKETVTDKFTTVIGINEAGNKVQVTVIAKEDAALNTKTPYSFRLKLQTDGLGTVYSKALTFKVKQSTVKTTVSGETALYTNYLNGTGTIQIIISKPQGVEIEKLEIPVENIPKGIIIEGITLDKETATVAYRMSEDAPKVLKKGKTYKLKCLMTPKGMATDKKPQTVSVNLVVKK